MPKLKVGDAAVGFDLPGVDGKRYSLDSFSGSPVLAVVFSCVHCPYVLAWEERIKALAAEYGPRGAAFVLINANDPVKYPVDSFDGMKKHADEKGFAFPFVQDQSQEVARAYGAERTPEVFLFDKDRRLVYTGAVDDNYDNPGAVGHRYLKDALDAALAGHPAPVASTPPVGCTIKWK
ncbi:thioredoxin family protein [bacterium]|nr:thioredoxin family protein [bacterium]